VTQDLRSKVWIRRRNRLRAYSGNHWKLTRPLDPSHLLAEKFLTCLDAFECINTPYSAAIALNQLMNWPESGCQIQRWWSKSACYEFNFLDYLRKVRIQNFPLMLLNWYSVFLMKGKHLRVNSSLNITWFGVIPFEWSKYRLDESLDFTAELGLDPQFTDT